ncbi:MAG: hypothetical protein ACYTG7_24345, partial [Planctomycetota bacterium]
YVRSLQNPDGSYGGPENKAITTPLVVLAFGTSPRRYTDLDGPFVRDAVEWMIDHLQLEKHDASRKENKNFSATALSLAAIATINPFRYGELIEKGQTDLIRSLSMEEHWTEISRAEALFYAAYALNRTSKDPADLLQTLNVREDSIPSLSIKEPQSIYKAIWQISINRSLREPVTLDCLINSITLALEISDREQGESEKHEAAGIASEKSFELTPVWAAVYLLAEMENLGKAPKAWADSISEPLGKRLQIALSREGDHGLKETALLINALSLCYGKVSAPQAPLDPAGAPLPAIVKESLELEEAVSKALKFLAENQHEGRFGFGSYPDPGITALALAASIRASRLLEVPVPDYATSGFEYLKSLQKEDGSIYQHGLANYVTSASIMAFTSAEREEYEEIIQAARIFLVELQADEGEGYSQEEDPFYGGVGYGGDERPDLSNTQMAVEAMRDAGLDEDHQAFKKAIHFLQRCQNLSEVNPTHVRISPKETVVSGNDGGGMYAPGESKADLAEVADGVFVARSYGSMTYALLKSYVLAGLEKDDPRVKAAIQWIRTHYTLDENPGFLKKEGRDTGQQGLYYYFLTMAKALGVLGFDTLETLDGVVHDWRDEMRARILSLQRVDGSWINHRAPRWFEGNPVLATSYALLVLDLCGKK